MPLARAAPPKHRRRVGHLSAPSIRIIPARHPSSPTRKKIGGQIWWKILMDRSGGKKWWRNLVEKMVEKICNFFVDSRTAAVPHQSRGPRRSRRPRGRFRSRSGNRPRDHHTRHLRALELRMHQTSPQKNEIEAVLWTIEFSSLHSPARLQLASLAGPKTGQNVQDS